MKTPSGNQPFTVRVKGDSMSPAIQGGDILLVDPRLPLENKAIVVAQIKNEVVCRRLVITDGRTLLVPDNHCPDNETIASDQRIIEVGEDAEILGRVKKMERWLIEDAEILGSVVGGYRSFVSPTDAAAPEHSSDEVTVLSSRG